MCLFLYLQISAKHFGAVDHRFDWFSLQNFVPNVSHKLVMRSSSHSASHMNLQAPILLFSTDATRNHSQFSVLKYGRRIWN